MSHVHAIASRPSTPPLPLPRQVFDLLLATGETFEDSGFTCAHMAAHSPHSLFLAGHESSTGLLDLRTRQLAWVNGSAHAKKVCASERKCMRVCGPSLAHSLPDSRP